MWGQDKCFLMGDDIRDWLNVNQNNGLEKDSLKAQEKKNITMKKILDRVERQWDPCCKWGY